MDIVRSNQTASSSINGRRFRYQVFLSFRGEDTRKTFTSHLSTALSKAGLHIFLDDNELPRGEDIKPQFREAIQLSQSSLVVFSQNYASSVWCLDELVMILERKRRFGQVVLPIFYHVDPTDARKQTGRVAEAFARHVNKESVKHKVEGWRKALAEFADLAGMVLKNQADGNEAKFIEKVVRVIENKLSHMSLSVSRDPIGIHSRVKEIDRWLQDESIEVGILGVYGIRGIGKTTIAKYLYDTYRRTFQASSFLENISQSSRTPNGLLEMQQKLLFDLLNTKKGRLHTIDEGRRKIEDAINSRKVLLVLDDVDHADQLDAIFMMQSRFSPGSKVIITTNNGGLLRARHQRIKMLAVTIFSDNESLELFSRHAFGQDTPMKGYIDYSKRAVKLCGGLPLALKVFGSSLSGQSLVLWESAFKKLEGMPNGEITNTLRISYDSLQDSHDQNLFLHIACFFIGMDKDDLVRILDSCDFFTDIGIQNLVERCLVAIDGNNKVQMHHMIRDMARKIISSESKDPNKLKRLWHPKDYFKVLTGKKDMQTIEGLNLDMEMIQVDHAHPRNSNDELILKTDAFARMYELRLLKLNHVQLNGSYEEFPAELIWLCWNKFSSDSFPNDFPLKCLVVLEMRYSRLKQVWRKAQYLPSLKTLNLSHSLDLTKTPDFSYIPNLESLILNGCTNLVDLHDSIENLQRLVNLNIEDCRNIRNLPKNLKFLKTFRADGIPIPELLTTIEVSSLLPRSLVTLSLVNCNLSDDHFPNGLRLSTLRSVNLSSNPITCLPDFIRGAPVLDQLTLRDCTQLRSLVKMPGTRNLDITRSTLLEKITGQSLRMVLRGISWNSNRNLSEFETWFKLDHSESVEEEMTQLFGPLNLQSTDTILISAGDPHVLWSRRTLPIQVLHEHGFVSTFLVGNEFPTKYSYTSTRGSSISFVVPSLPNGQSIQALNIFCVYAESNNGDCRSTISKIKDGFPQPIMATVSNKSKGKKWWYGPLFFGIPRRGEDILWLCHWNLRSHLKSGDEVTVSIFTRTELHVKECGIMPLYQKDIQHYRNKYYPEYWTMSSGILAVDYMCWSTLALKDGDFGKTDWFKYLMEHSDKITEKEEGYQHDGGIVETVVYEAEDKEKLQEGDEDDVIEHKKKEEVSSGELGSIEECLDVLEAMDGVDDAAYLKACEKFEHSIAWRKIFMKMSEKRKIAWVNSFK